MTSTPRPPSPRRGLPRPGWLPLVPVVVAVLAFGGVHPGPRALVAACCGGALLVVVLGARKGLSASAPALAAAVLGALLWLTAGLRLLPVGARTRAALQGELAPLVERSLELSGVETAPLAVDLPAAVDAWGMTGGALALGLAATLLLRTRSRRLGLASGVVALGCLLTVLAAAHRWTGQAHIYGVSGLPSAPLEPFFGTFINPNHGALVVAAGVPLAAALAARKHTPARLLAAVGGLVCVGGLVLAGSRGGLAVGAAGLVLTLTLALPRSLGFAIGGGAVLTAGVGLGLGLQRLVGGLTRVLMPAQAAQDPLGSRPSIWRHTLRLAEAAAPAGTGPGGLADALPVFTATHRYRSTAHAHQEVLQAVAELGLVEGLLWCGLVVLPFVVGLRRVLLLPRGRRRWLGSGLLGALLTILLASLWGFPLRIQALALLTACLAGALLAMDGQDQRRSGPRLLLPGLVAALGLASLTPGLGTLWAVVDSDAPTAVPQTVLDTPDASALAPDDVTGALRWQPLDWRLVVQLSRQQAAAGSLDAALQTAAHAVVLAPELPWPHVLSARLHARSGDQSAAWMSWRTALSKNLPDNDRALPWLEAAIEGAADPVLALAAVVPERGDRLRDAAGLAARLGDPWTARSFYERGVEADPAVAASYARFLLGEGDPDGAARMLAEVPLPLRGHCGVLATRGEVALELGDPVEGLALLRSAQRVCARGKEPDLRWPIARALEATGDRSGVELFEELLKEQPDRHTVRRALLRALERQGRYEEMVPHLGWLVRAEAATLVEKAVLERVEKGLPPRYDPALRPDEGPPGSGLPAAGDEPSE